MRRPTRHGCNSCRHHLFAPEKSQISTHGLFFVRFIIHYSLKGGRYRLDFAESSFRLDWLLYAAFQLE